MIGMWIGLASGLPVYHSQFASVQNSELKDVIKKILDGANLEEVTMKTVVKQVCLPRMWVAAHSDCQDWNLY